jgi:hypothetical protein
MDYENREAWRRSQGPATALIAVGVFSILLGLVFGLLAGAAVIAPDDEPAVGAAEQPTDREDEENERMLGVGLFVVVGLVQLLHGVIVLCGAISMLRLKSSALGMTAAIAAGIPCTMCFPVGLPIGVWALLALNHPDVRMAFEEARADRF